ncbi:MAG: O-succinylbenzoate synthase, partial [Actinobacteria bacterium]|nr:O-succinylbenzoate synthase [Actinomycetota bacterium]
MRRVPFRIPLRVPVGDVVERSGDLIEGPAGWGEYSPLPSWSQGERDAAERSALEAASEPFPARLRDV